MKKRMAMIGYWTGSSELAETSECGQTKVEYSHSLLKRSRGLVRGARERVEASCQTIQVYRRDFSRKTTGNNHTEKDQDGR
jgi:hypothetical protein